MMKIQDITAALATEDFKRLSATEKVSAFLNVVSIVLKMAENAADWDEVHHETFSGNIGNAANIIFAETGMKPPRLVMVGRTHFLTTMAWLNPVKEMFDKYYAKNQPALLPQRGNCRDISRRIQAR